MLKKAYKSSLGLGIKLLIVLLLPLLLFSYIDSQPRTVSEDDDDKEGTRSVAIVNEDLGHESKTEELLLGQEVTTVLNDSDDYSWVVVSRSAAERGFDNEEYDAILYLPSNFSENIMTFKDDSPSKASIDYVVQPNLEAKERQRVHREMANAKSTINYEMSTIYWDYVAQEVDGVREQFDKVLEKEIAFQEAMYDFYSPSSETLANEIDRHKSSLENILEQTQRVGDSTSDNASSAEEAEERVAEFIETLDDYEESQAKQQEMLSEFDEENQKAIQASIDQYDDMIDVNMKDIEEQYKAQSVLIKDQEDALHSRFGTMEGKLNQGQDIIDDWREYQEGKGKKQPKSFEKVTEKIVKEYNDLILDEWFTEANEEFDESVKAFIDAPINTTLIEPIEPDADEDETESSAREELEAALQSVETLEQEIAVIKEITDESVQEENPDPEEGEEQEDQEDPAQEGEPIDWSNVDANIAALKDHISDALEHVEDGSADDALEAWQDYAEEWEENYNTIVEETDEATKSIVKGVKKKQKSILKNKVLSDKRKQQLEKQFNKAEDIDDKTLTSLVAYTEALASYETVINQKTNINKKLVKEIIDDEDIQKDLEKLFEVNYKFANKLEDVLGVKKERKAAKRQQEKDEANFKELIDKTEGDLKDWNEQIEDAMADHENIVREMNESASEVAQQIEEANSESFDGDDLSSLHFPDGQMVFQIQEGTTSSLENLSDQVGRLGESQQDITSDTEELQMKVGSVQEESDSLNMRWASNVETTEQVKDDVYDVLGNTMVDGQANPFVYDYLANPVNVEGHVEGEVLSESEDRMPPVVLFIIILLSGLMIGFLTQYYSSNSYLIQGALFFLLNVAVGLIISIYGLSIYTLQDSHAIMWSIFTIVLLMACSNIIRAGLFINPFVGWLATIAMIMFFISPLLNVVVSEFSFNNPVSNVYMSLLYGTSASYGLTIAALIVIILLVSALTYAIQVMRNKKKAEEENAEEAS